MSTFVLSDEAEADIAGIIEYISKRNLAAATKMLERIENRCQMLAENPGLGEERQSSGVLGCRSFTVIRYVLFFRPTANGIDVARILDASRDL